MTFRGVVCERMATSIGEGFRGPDGRVGYVLRQAQHAFHVALDNSLRPLDITAAQFGVLRLVEIEPGATGAELAADSMFTTQSTHAILVSLEEVGLVERRRDPRDRRVRRMYLSDPGTKVLAAAHEIVIALEDRMTAGLSARERRQFNIWLVGAAEALDHRTPAGP
jgi:DNA-binding MarR family transcriptional regulator